MPSSVYVRLPEQAREALYELADREWRDPRDQAAKLVIEGLHRAGALTEDNRPGWLRRGGVDHDRGWTAQHPRWPCLAADRRGCRGLRCHYRLTGAWASMPAYLTMS